MKDYNLNDCPDTATAFAMLLEWLHNHKENGGGSVSVNIPCVLHIGSDAEIEFVIDWNMIDAKASASAVVATLGNGRRIDMMADDAPALTLMITEPERN